MLCPNLSPFRLSVTKRIAKSESLDLLESSAADLLAVAKELIYCARSFFSSVPRLIW